MKVVGRWVLGGSALQCHAQWASALGQAAWALALGTSGLHWHGGLHASWASANPEDSSLGSCSTAPGQGPGSVTQG